MVQETISVWFARIAFLAISMVRMSCILLLHFAFSVFIVAERLGYDYDAWDDSEENTTATPQEKACTSTPRKPKPLFQCLEGYHFEPYLPSSLYDFEKRANGKCERWRVETISLENNHFNFNPCTHLSTVGPIVVEFPMEVGAPSKVSCWTYGKNRNTQAVRTKEFKSCSTYQLTLTPEDTGVTEKQMSKYIWGLNWS